MTFPAALEAVSARGREMAHLTVEDNGAMAAVFAPLDEIEKIVAETDGYVVIANVNSTAQAVIGGATAAVAGRRREVPAARLPDRHAPRQPRLPHLDRGAGQRTAAAHAGAPRAAAAGDPDRGQRHRRASTRWGPTSCPRCSTCWPPRWRRRSSSCKGLRTLYDEGARVFVEVGPKKALQGFAADVLGDDVVALATNHPKLGDATAFNQALCGLYAAGSRRG